MQPDAPPLHCIVPGTASELAASAKVAEVPVVDRDAQQDCGKVRQAIVVEMSAYPRLTPCYGIALGSKSQCRCAPIMDCVLAVCQVAKCLR